MIETLDEFLKAYENRFPADAHDSEGEYFFEDLRRSTDAGFSETLIEQMRNLGILYIHGGAMVINPMAIRVLKRMRGESTAMNSESFRREIEVSRDLYHIDHLEEEAELAGVRWVP